MRWPTVALGVLVSLLVVASPAVGFSTNPEPALLGVPRLVPLWTDELPLPNGGPDVPLAPHTPVSLTFTLSNPRALALNGFLMQVENPASPSYRHFLSYPTFVSEFAPPVSSVARIEAAIGGMGGQEISVAPDRSSVTAVLSAGSVESLLGVHLVTYGSAKGLPLYTAVGTATLPPSLAGTVASVSGLSDASTAAIREFSPTNPTSPRPWAADRAQFIHDNASGEDWFVGSDYTQAYGAIHLFPGTHSVANATYPSSVAVATLLASAYNLSTQTNLPPWDPAVIVPYLNGTLGPGWPMPNLTGVPVTVNGVTPPLPGSFRTYNDSTAYEFENSLDLEMVGSLAPGASIYNFYFGGSLLTGTSTVGDAANYLTADLAQALAHNYSPAHLTVVSCSFGLPDLDNGGWDAELLTAAATGVTITSASGDQGNAPDSLTGRGDGQWPIWPATAASNASGAISVGGVTLGLSGSPASYSNVSGVNLTYDATAGSFTNVTAWYDTLGGQGTLAGTEGGASTVFPEPTWQSRSTAQPAVVNATVRQQATSLGRAGPDVAMPGNATAVTVFANSTGVVYFDVLEGTSIAAPVLAGLLADVVAVENHGAVGPWKGLGFIDPEIYRIASYFAAHASAGGDPFLDVTTGSNYVFTAAPGWDPLTGWGGVNAPAFLAADENSTLQHYNYTGPTIGLPSAKSNPPAAPVPWTFIYAIFGVGLLVAIILVVVAARPSRRTQTPPGVPWGAQLGGPAFPTGPAAPPGTLSGATFLCPYCGAIRPSEPVRCPRCGAF